MLKDFFNFSRKRTMREAAVFCVFHMTLLTLVFAGLSVLE